MKIFLLGKDGQVGGELQRALCVLGEITAPGQEEVDLERPEVLRRALRAAQPGLIVNAAAHTAVDRAETEPELAHAVNASAVGVLAEEAARSGAWLVHYSTDYVFDGRKATPYVEDDATAPLSVYGRSKLAGEEAIRAQACRHLIFRTSWVYAARGNNFARTMLRLAREHAQLKVVADQIGAPTSAELIADVTALALYRVLGGENAAGAPGGTYHLVAGGETSWHGYARHVIALARERGARLKAGPQDVEPLASEAWPQTAARPKNSRLDTGKLCTAFGLRMPDWRLHVGRVVDQLLLSGAP